MFERFTTEARRAVTMAAEQASERGEGRVGSEHVLIALFGTASSSSHVTALGLTSEQLRRSLDELDEEALRSVGVMGPLGVPRKSRKGHIRFTGSAKEALVGALRHALELGDRRIGAEHILLGILDLPHTDRAIRVLGHVGSSPADLRADLDQAMRRAS